MSSESEVRIHDVSEGSERPRAGVARDTSDAGNPNAIGSGWDHRTTENPSTPTPPNPPPSRDHNVDRTIEPKRVSEHKVVSVSQLCNCCKLTNEKNRLAAAVSF